MQFNVRKESTKKKKMIRRSERWGQRETKRCREEKSDKQKRERPQERRMKRKK